MTSTNTINPRSIGSDYAENLTDLFRRVQILEQQAEGISGVVNTFPGGIVVGTGGGATVVTTAISSVTGLTTSGGAYLGYGYADVNWTIPDATVDEVEVFYALKAISGGTYDIPRSVMVSGTGTRINSLIAGRTYGIYVVPRNILGIPGTATPAFVSGLPVYQDVVIPQDSTVPPTLASILTNLGSDTLVVAWTPVPSTELDVLDGGYYEAQIDATDNTFTHVLQDWRGSAAVMSFDGLGALTGGTTTLARSGTLPTISSISNALTAITAAVAGNGIFTLTLGTGHGVLANEIVTLTGFTPTNYNGTWFVQSITSTTVVLSAATFVVGAPVNATVMGTGVNNTKWTYTFASAHGLSVGNYFDITGFVPIGYNSPNLLVFAVPTTTTLTVLNGTSLPGAITTVGTSGYGIISSTQTVVKTTSTTGFPTSGNYSILNSSEQMLVTTGQGTTTLGVTRGYNGTTPQVNAQEGTKITSGPAQGSFWVRVRAVSVGGVPGAWTLANSGSPVQAGGVSGTDILARTITAVSIQAGSITSNEIAANTIQAANIAAGTITATQLGAIQLTVGQYIRSSNYLAGVSGWNIDQNGNAEFNNVMVRGVIDSSIVIGSVIETAASGMRAVMGANSITYSWSSVPVASANIAFHAGGTGAGDDANPATIASYVDFSQFSGLFLYAPGGTVGNWSSLIISTDGVIAQSFTNPFSVFTKGMTLNSTNAELDIEVDGVFQLALTTQGNILMEFDTTFLLEGTTGVMQFQTGGQVSLTSTSNSVVLEATSSGQLIFLDSPLVNMAGLCSVDNTLTADGLANSNNITTTYTGFGNWLWIGGDGRPNFTISSTLTSYTTLNAFAFNATSDRSLKENIVEVADSSLLHKLRPVSFSWKDRADEPGTHFGLIAQEVQSIFPDMVKEVIGPDTLHSLEERNAAKRFGVQLPKAKSPGVGTGLLTMNYSELIPLLVSEVQKLRQAVDTLQGAH